VGKRNQWRKNVDDREKGKVALKVIERAHQKPVANVKNRDRIARNETLKDFVTGYLQK
jgi:hypothetical protein